MYLCGKIQKIYICVKFDNKPYYFTNYFLKIILYKRRSCSTMLIIYFHNIITNESKLSRIKVINKALTIHHSIFESLISIIKSKEFIYALLK